MQSGKRTLSHEHVRCAIFLVGRNGAIPCLLPCSEASELSISSEENVHLRTTVVLIVFVPISFFLCLKLFSAGLGTNH